MIEIRQGKCSDIPPLSEVYARAYTQGDNEEQWSVESARAFLEVSFHRQPDLLFVAAENEELAGGSWGAVRPWWDGIYLVDAELFVDPSHQEQGVGKRLMKHLVTAAQLRHKVNRIEAVTFRNSEFPLNWYKHLGFHPSSELVVIEAKVEDVLSKLSE